MWPFFLTYVKTYTKVIPNTSEDDVLRVLHDPPVLARLSPLVIKCEALDPSRPGLYVIHEELTVLKVFKSTIVINTNFTPTSDGTDRDVRAGAWTTLKGKWRVRRDNSGDIEVSETVTVRCIFIFLPFITRTLDSASTTLLERLTGEVMKGKVP